MIFIPTMAAMYPMTALIFDIDGTLTNTTKVDDKCFTQAFKSVFGIDISNQNWAELNNVTDWGITEELVLKNWNRTPTKSEYKKMLLEFIPLLQTEFINNKEQFQEINGASDFVNQIKQEPNIGIGIATGAWEKSAQFKLKSIGINPNEYAFSNSSRFKKREDIVSDTIRQLNQKFENQINRVIYFGDGAWDFLTCKKLEIEFVGIDSSNSKKLKKLGAKNVFNDFSKADLIFDIVK